MSRRAKGEGSIVYVESRKEWQGKLPIGKTETGKTKYKYFYGGKGGKKSDLVRRMKEWELSRTKPTSDNAMASTPLSSAIAVWLKTIKRPELKRSSYDRLESIIVHQINPRIGHYPISELTDSIIQEELLDDISSDGLSLSTAKKAYDALNAYLKYAQYKQFISLHPMTMMKPPRASAAADEDTSPKVVEPLTDIELHKFVAATKICYSTGTPRFPMAHAIMLILNTGLRVGEAVALKWSDVNLETATLSVSKNIVRVRARDKNGVATGGGVVLVQDSPKTKKARRTIPLNKAAVEALRCLKMTPGTTDSGFIIHTKNGNPVSVPTLDKTIRCICIAAGIRHITAHTLRHTYATKLFERKVDVKIISDILGHSSTEVTYRIYIHVIERLKHEAVQTAFDILDERPA